MAIYGSEILSAQNLKALYELALVDVSYTKIEYSFKMYDGDTLVRNYIPVIRKTDNLVGLFDLKTKTFYENSGTQPFIAGPAI